jgi:hypothetical protein
MLIGPNRIARLARRGTTGTLSARRFANKCVTRRRAAFFLVAAMGMQPLKDGIRSEVRIDFYGNVHKRLRGTAADKRYATEVKVLKVLEERGCPYVPKLLEEHPDELYFVTSNCGKIADQITKDKADRLFAKLEREYGVRHLDAEPRNITYSDKLGCFCIIDFELAEILPSPSDTPPM